MTADAEAQVEGAEQRARFGMGSLGQQSHTFRFQPDLLTKILEWNTRERSTPSIKELEKLECMKGKRLTARMFKTQAQEALRNETLIPFASLFPVLDLKDRVVQPQRDSFKDAALQEDDLEAEFPPLPSVADAARPSEDIPAFFVPGDTWRRPSDYVKYRACRFEDGLTGTPPPPGMPVQKKKLTEDQIIFLARFAEICDCVWDDIQNDVPMHSRRRYSILLLGQGGSGKTAVVQDIWLAVMDFLFPPDESATPPKSSLIVCASWAQAENISNKEHKAITIHKASSMRVQSMRNADMAPGDRLSQLKKNVGKQEVVSY